MPSFATQVTEPDFRSTPYENIEILQFITRRDLSSCRVPMGFTHRDEVIKWMALANISAIAHHIIAGERSSAQTTYKVSQGSQTDCDWQQVLQIIRSMARDGMQIVASLEYAIRECDEMQDLILAAQTSQMALTPDVFDDYDQKTTNAEEIIKNLCPILIEGLQAIQDAYFDLPPLPEEAEEELRNLIATKIYPLQDRFADLTW